MWKKSASAVQKSSAAVMGRAAVPKKLSAEVPKQSQVALQKMLSAVTRTPSATAAK
ncbi:hypothetical protein PF010_g22820 [Phytophthora fragariae]|nr:hypothetical protein PF009_g28568 [Phytophthora fragariae]KAE9079251.1 hypothetical protein PF010_g22820 [Phytophthora fragariae]KAE9281772.1 hypothetical protein PF008_g27805 [Phytophthora fragariae]